MTFTDALSTPEIPGFKCIGTTKDGMWGEFVEDDGQNRTETDWQNWKQERQLIQQQRAVAEAQRQSKALPATERDRLYHQLLNQLSLNPADRDDLYKRGLTDDEIIAGGFKSVEQWQTLEAELNHLLPGVQLSGQSLNTQAGYLCPIYDVDGYLVGFQIRLRDAADGGRYRWLTSSTQKRPDGQTPHLPNGELPLTVRRPVNLQRSAIGMAEGIGAKPYIISLRFGQVVVGATGGQFSSSPKTLRATVEKLSTELNTTLIDFYVDAGAVQNPNVLRQYRRTWTLLKRWGYTVRVVWWGQVAKDAPDGDELEDIESVRLITVDELEAIADEYQLDLRKLTDLKRYLRRSVGRTRPQGFKKAEVSEPSTPLKPISYLSEELPKPGQDQPPPIIRFQAGQRLQVIQNLVDQGWQHILDRSAPGLGKSHDAGIAHPEMFGCDRIWYFSDTHRNPTTTTIEQNYTDMPVRNDGMVTDQTRKTQTGNAHVRWPQAGEKPDTAGNCFRAKAFSILRAKNIAVEGADNPVCGTCHLYHACRQGSGPGYGHRYERHQAFQSDRIRLNPDSAPNPDDTSLAQDGAFWDEAMKIIQPVQTVSVQLSDFDQQMATLETDLPEVHSALKPLRQALRPLLDGEITQPRYGWDERSLREILPAIPENLDNLIASVTSSSPDLTDYLEEPDGIDLTTASAKEKAILSNANKTLRQESYRESIAQLIRLPLQWLAWFLSVWGNICTGAIRVEHKTLVITVRSDRHSTLAKSLAWNVYQDATADPHYLGLYLGVDFSKIVIIEEEPPNLDNLEVIQIKGLGLAGKNRSDSCDRRIAALKAELRQRHPDIAFLEPKDKAEKGDGWWFNHNRGSNEFDNRSAIASFGVPYQNIGASLGLYQTLVGHPVEATNPDFKAFICWQTDAEIIQTSGRLRAHQRPDQKLVYYFCADYELPASLNARTINAHEVAIAAGNATEQTLYKIGQAAKSLLESGQTLTQKAIGQVTGISQGRISQIFGSLGGWSHWKKILVSLLETSYRDTNIFAGLDEEARWIAKTFLGIVVEESPLVALETVNSIVVAYGINGWNQILAATPLEIQSRLLVALLSVLPDRWKVELQQVMSTA